MGESVVEAGQRWMWTVDRGVGWGRWMETETTVSRDRGCRVDGR
jgi:hypothetical protein